MTALAAILVAARDEEERIGATVEALREQFPGVAVVVADDGSRDGTAAVARAAGATVVSCPRLGKGQALTLGERATPAGSLLLCDADLTGDLRRLVAAGADADLVVAAFARRSSGGFGLAKRTARTLGRLLGGVDLGEPLSGQRVLSGRARAALFPVAAGFGTETRMNVDAGRAGLVVREVELDLAHRATAQSPAGFLHRARQLVHLVLACGPQETNFRGLRLPLVGSAVGAACPRVMPIALLGLADDLWSGAERGFRAHLRTGATTGTLKLVGIPLYALVRTRSLSGATVIALSANVLNQLDTRPGRALKAFGLGAALVRGVDRRGLGLAVLLAPYDLQEMWMLGDGGSNALGALLGWRSVERLGPRGRIAAAGALAALTIVGERRSLGSLIETTPGLRGIDRLGRRA